jgi:hypothetical protein
MKMLLLPLVLLTLAFAPAPFPRASVLREIETLSQAAAASCQTANSLNQRLLLESSLPAQKRADLQKQLWRAKYRAASQFSRLAHLLDSLI